MKSIKVAKPIFVAVGIFVLLAFMPVSSKASVEVVAEKKSYSVAVLAFRDKASTTARWQPLIDYLNQQLSLYDFRLAIYHLGELEQAVAANEVDFVLTQPAHYVLMTYRSGLTSPLASMLNLEGDFVTDHFGGVIFTLQGRDDIVNLADIKGKTIAAAATSSLGAFQMQAYELLAHGIRLPNNAKLIETGQPQRNAVDAVLKGEADVGFVRTGVLEELVELQLLDMRRIKLLNAQRFPDFPFVTSTRLYPEWPFAAMPQTDKDVARQVASVLLSIPREGQLARAMGIGGFTISGDYRTIDLLMRELRLEPFDDFQLTLTEMINWWFKEIILVLLLVMTAVVLFITVLIKRQVQLKQERHRLTLALDKVRLLNQAVEQSPESVVITDTQGRLIYMNPMFENTTGYKVSEVKGKNPRVLSSGKTPKAVYQSMWQSLSNGETWRGELSNKRKNGEIYPSHAILSPVKDETGKTTHFLAIQRDVSERKKQEKRIQELLYLDSVTGMANRNKLLETMDITLHRIVEVEVKGCLVLVNLSRFKFINQLHGVDVGDGVLKTVAQRLKDAFSQNGVVARLAADEFAVFCENKVLFTEVDDWLKMMGQRALTALETPLQIKGEAFKLDVGVGVAPLGFESDVHSSGEAINQTFNQAGMALKEAREQGGHGLKIFNASLLAASLELHQLQHQLAAGIKANELRLFVQPQYDQTQTLVGVECLVRWQHPQKGLLLPASFIPLAESSDLIVALGDWVLREACLILAEVQRTKPSVRVAVNISPRHFRQTDFIASCKSHLEVAKANPKGLMLEITENLFLDDFEDVVEKMNLLKKLGVAFSIDDFGTGYSSLSYLQHLPVDELKIDRSFILGMGQYGTERSLVSSIYAMGQQMQLTVIAEGIETETQRSQLAEFDELQMQGFLFAKPEAVQSWLKRWQQGV